MAKTYDNGKISLALIAKDIEYIKKDVSEIKTKIDSDYVTKEEFIPVQRVVFGLVALILTAVVGALVGLVVLR